MEWLELLLEDRAVLRDLIATLLLLLVLIVLRSALAKLIRRIKWAREEDRLRWRTLLRSVTVVLLAAGVFLIWGSELRTFALSLVAVAVALVIATKELILCVTGSVYRWGSGNFTVGDRVAIGDLQGDVLDTGLFATRLLEVGPAFQHTGRIVTIPNSVLLNGALTNESMGGNYILHVIRVPLTLDADWRDAERRLLGAACDVCSRYFDDARTSLLALSSQRDWEVPPRPEEDVKGRPSVLLRIESPTQLELLLRVPTPARSKGHVEQAILRLYLTSQVAAASQAAS